MTDQWVPAPPQPPAPDPPDGLPPANSWSPVTPCASADSPSIADGVIITGRPAVVSAMPWQITVNDGNTPANFSIDHYDASGVLIESPIFIEGSSGDVMLTHDPTQPLGVATKQYADAREGLPDAPSDGHTYGRGNAAWAVTVPEAPIDGTLYGRGAVAWTPINAQFMPYSGGVFTGVVTFPANNSVAINGPAGSQRSILAGSASSWRWQVLIADMTPETGANTGSNFAVTSLDDNASAIATPLSINRATSVVTIAAKSGIGAQAPTLALNKATAAPGGNLIQGQRNGVVRWQMNLGDFNAELGGNLGSNFRIDRYDDTGATMPGTSPLVITRATGVVNFAFIPSIPGGNNGDVLSTNGGGALSWVPPATGGGGSGDYLPLIGGTLTGELTITSNNAWFFLNKTTGGGGNQYASVYGQKDGVDRWELCLGGAAAESGGNAGSDCLLYRYDDTGAFLGAAFTFNRATGLGTVAGDPTAALGIATKQYVDAHAGGGGGIADAPNDGTAYARKSAAWSHLTHTDITDWTASLAPYALTTALASYLPLGGGTLTGQLSGTNVTVSGSLALNQPTAAQGNAILAYTANSIRWGLFLGNGVAESGSNAGSNLSLNRYSDAGVYIDSPLSIIRSSGAAAFSSTLTAATINLSGAGTANTISAAYWLTNGQRFNLAQAATQTILGVNAGASQYNLINSYSVGAPYTVLLNTIGYNNTGGMAAWLTAGGSTTWTSVASDPRLKSAIIEADKDALAAINSLQVYEFDMNYETESHHWNWGLMATEETGELIPASYIPAAETDLGTVYAGLNPLVLIGALVKAVQQLTARVAELEAARG